MIPVPFGARYTSFTYNLLQRYNSKPLLVNESSSDLNLNIEPFDPWVLSALVPKNINLESISSIIV